jgi:hypothetical protein
MNKDTLLMLTDEQVEQIIAADHNPGHGKGCPEVTTLACGEEGPVCSAC